MVMNVMTFGVSPVNKFMKYPLTKFQSFSANFGYNESTNNIIEYWAHPLVFETKAGADNEDNQIGGDL